VGPWQVDKWAVICCDVNLNGSVLIATWDICVATSASERDSSGSHSHSRPQSHSYSHFHRHFGSSLHPSYARILNFPTAPDMQIIMIYWLWKICATAATQPKKKKWEWFLGKLFSQNLPLSWGHKRWISQAYWLELGVSYRLLLLNDKCDSFESQLSNLRIGSIFIW